MGGQHIVKAKDTTMSKLLATLLIVANLLLVFLFLGLRGENTRHHRFDVEEAYQGLVSRGMLDEAKSEDYARTHNGWHPRKRLEMIGAPDGYPEVLFWMALGACAVNAATIFFLARTKEAGSTKKAE